jgi:hypothetical protein
MKPSFAGERMDNLTFDDFVGIVNNLKKDGISGKMYVSYVRNMCIHLYDKRF